MVTVEMTVWMTVLMLKTIIPAEPRWFLARFCFVIGQDICSVQPLGVIVEEAALLVQAVGAEPVLGPRLQHLALLPAVVHRGPQVVGAVGEGAVGAVLDAVAAVVGVVDAHAGLVVAEVVAPLRVPGSSVQEWTPRGRR